MAITRQRPNISNPIAKSFFGIQRVISPLTRSEIEGSGFTLAEMPEGYVQDKTFGSWGQLATMGLKTSHMILQGEVSGGKDIFAPAYASTFNLPHMSFAFKAGLAPNEWVCRTDLVEGPRGGTITEIVEGSLMKACRGVTVKRDLTMMSQEARTSLKASMEKALWTVTDVDGTFTITVPAVILFSDYDRASPEQLEVLRQALELNKERLVHPVTGELIPILKGTRFIFTANSGSDGAENSNNLFNAKDGSLLSRLVAVHVPPITKSFEREVIKVAYPSIHLDDITILVDCIHAVRKLAKEQPLGLEVSLRQTKQWASLALQSMEDFPTKINSWKYALKFSFAFLKGHLGINANRTQFDGAVEVYLSEDEGDPSEVTPSNCPIDQ